MLIVKKTEKLKINEQWVKEPPPCDSRGLLKNSCAFLLEISRAERQAGNGTKKSENDLRSVDKLEGFDFVWVIALE